MLVGPNGVEIELSNIVGARPEATPNRGARRIVKMVETPVGWGWALWTSPYQVTDSETNPQDCSLWPCRVCVVLVGKGPPKPEPVIMTIPQVILDKYPEDAVEW